MDVFQYNSIFGQLSSMNHTIQNIDAVQTTQTAALNQGVWGLIGVGLALIVAVSIKS